MLDLTLPALRLQFLPSTYHLLRLPTSSPIPSAILDLLSSPNIPPTFVSITRTAHEQSIILPSTVFASILPGLPSSSSSEHFIPSSSTSTSPFATPARCPSDDPLAHPGVDTAGPYHLLRIAGPMVLSLTGVMHRLCGPLKEAEVAVFTSSTWDTDYVLIGEEERVKAVQALEKDGWTFED